MMYFPNRTICDALNEIRDADKAKNYSYLLGLVEEIQAMANRMEAKLYDQKDYERMVKESRKLRKRLRKQKDELDEQD